MQSKETMVPQGGEVKPKSLAKFSAELKARGQTSN